MICCKCGRVIPNDSLFCPECGAEQNVKHQQPQSSKEDMMFCENCGARIPPDSLFCPSCSAKQSHIQSENRQSSTKHDRSSSNKKKSPVQDIDKLKKRNKKIGLVIGAVAAFCVVLIALSVLVKPTINLNKYVTVSFTGYNTVGQANATFDTEKFREDYEKKVHNKVSDIGFNADMFLLQCVEGGLNKESGLSNGDVITYSWNCDDKMALSVYGCKLKYKDIDVTVDNLKEVKTFNPFDGIQVVFEGIDSDGFAYIDGKAKESAAQDLEYEFDKNSGLSNGDSVNVTVSLYNDDPIEYCLQKYGMIPSPLTKTYKVDGLGGYIKTVSDISNESLEDMKEQAEDVYDTSVARNWSEYEQLEDFKYIGNYLLINKNSNSYGGDNNLFYLVFKVQVRNNYSMDGQTYNKVNDIYWYICFYDLLVDNNGKTTVDLTNYRTPTDQFTVDSGIRDDFWITATKSWDYYGYPTLDELYKNVVTSNIEFYTVEDNTAEDNIDEDTESVKENDNNNREEGIVFPDSSEKVISTEDIKKLSDEEIRYAINEIYARHGYSFNDKELKAFYEKYNWYHASIKPDEFSVDLFNSVEKKNIEALQQERDSRK